MNFLLEIASNWGSQGDFFSLDNIITHLNDWRIYDKDNPLLFSSPLFLGLFLFFYIIYVLLRDTKYFFLRKIYVIVFSLFFYYKGGGNYYILLLACAIFTHWLSRLMYAEENPKKRKRKLIGIIVLNLLVLSYYKYTNFLTGELSHLLHKDWELFDIIVPVGISFFVFEAISYATDLYRKQMEPAKSTLDFCFYISFFPKLVAGPIIRAKDFMPQMYQKLTLDNRALGAGVFLIIIGLIKKAVISDFISVNYVDRIFLDPVAYSPFEVLLGVYGYSLQIYCDFSGYSDMAIGLALLLGFKIPPNFRTPYQSLSITEFWRRWHISLSSWLRDYLYISLGGNRKGKIRTYINLFLTMIIGGIWHGASWTFMIWGAMHGFVLVVERILKQFINLPKKWYINIFRIFITFNIVTFCWIFFKAKTFDAATVVISRISEMKLNLPLFEEVLVGYKNVFIIMLIGYVMHFIPQKWTDQIKELFISSPIVIKAIILGFVFWLVYATMSTEPTPFIYTAF